VGSSGEGKSGKACLFLSLIVLVWNVGATGRHFLLAEPLHPGIPGPFEPAPQGPPTGKQKFLLGKRVDINLAPLAEIEGLPGISRKTAESVIETRKRLGGFRTPADLLKVAGIKEKRLKKILPFLVQFPNN
jgi:competence ComEA-like helix-hairpin-helix protein